MRERISTEVLKASKDSCEPGRSLLLSTQSVQLYIYIYIYKFSSYLSAPAMVQSIPVFRFSPILLSAGGQGRYTGSAVCSSTCYPIGGSHGARATYRLIVMVYSVVAYQRKGQSHRECEIKPECNCW